jgi:hypothetical protein
MTFWFGAGCRSGSCHFRHGPSRRQQTTKFKIKFFWLLLFEGTFTSFFKDKKVQKKSQNNRNQGFSYLFCLMIEGSGSIHLTNGSDSGSGRPQKHVDPANPDPDCYFHKIDDAVVISRSCRNTASGCTVDGNRNPIIDLEI